MITSPALRRSTAAALVAGAALCLAPPVAAQDWRAEVDAVLDRWADDVGGGRLDRARALLERRAGAAPDDGLVRVELARVLLALDRASEALPVIERALGAFADEEKAQRQRLDLQNADRARNGLEPLPLGSELIERRARGLAVAYLVATEHTLARARTLEGAATATFLQEKQQELSRRRQALFAVAGEARGGELLRQESGRRQHLRTLDRLGLTPRPIGQLDAAGQPMELGVYRGKVLLVLFWSQALGGCEDVMVEVDGVARELGPRGLEVVGVCLDAPGGAASEWLAAQRIAWRQVFVEEGLTSRDAVAWQVDTVPSGVLVDHTGRLRWVDPWQGGDLRLAVEELLRRKDEAAAAAAQRRGW